MKLPVIRLQDPRAIAYIEKQRGLGREIRRTVELALIAAAEAEQANEAGQVSQPAPAVKPKSEPPAPKPQPITWDDDDDGFEIPPPKRIGDFNF